MKVLRFFKDWVLQESINIMIIFEKEAIYIYSRPIYFIKTIVIFGEGIYFCEKT